MAFSAPNKSVLYPINFLFLIMTVFIEPVFAVSSRISTFLSIFSLKGIDTLNPLIESVLTAWIKLSKFEITKDL